MDYEKEYKNALERAKKELQACGDMNCDATRQIFRLFPELEESQDEKMRKFLYEFIKICAWSEKQYPPREKCLAYLEKQKEQKPEEPSDEELQRHQDELYDFKAFAAKQAKEHHISFVNDFEWNNFCDELLSFFYEKHTTDGKALLHVAEKSYQIGLRDGRMEQKPDKCIGCNNIKGCITCVDGEQWAHIEEEPENDSSKKRNNQWDWEDDVNLNAIIEALRWCNNEGMNPDDIDPDYLISWLKNRLKSLCPHWKPSEEQMTAFKKYIEEFQARAEAAVGGWNNFDVMIRLFEQLKKL